MVEDTSTNGTFLNGERLARQKPTTIKEGDLLRLSLPPAEVLE